MGDKRRIAPDTDGVRQKPPGGEEFICEQLRPVAATSDTKMMSRGEPGLPRRFHWRDLEYELIGLISSWKTQGQCRNGSSEMYLRRHWYKIQARPVDQSLAHLIMTVYCDRQAKQRSKPKSRWWVFTIER